MRYYLIPKIGTGKGLPGQEGFDPFRPKYLEEMFKQHGRVLFIHIPYKDENMFVGYAETTDSQHDFLISKPDVFELKDAPNAQIPTKYPSSKTDAVNYLKP